MPQLAWPHFFVPQTRDLAASARSGGSRALAALEPERAVNCLFKIGLGLEDRLRRKLDRVVEADPDTLADAKKKGAFAKLCEMHDKGLL